MKTVKLQIIIVQQGWVIVGEADPTSTHIEVQNASVVRRWGTTKGLGELAMKGPRPETILDYAGRVEIPNHAVVLRIDCDEKGWNAFQKGMGAA